MGDATFDMQPRPDVRTPGLLRPLALLWLAGVMLRLTILALPPVLPPIEADFHLRGLDIGVLAALPSLFFSLAALPGAALIGRFGATPSLLVGLFINASGAAARGFTDDVTGLEVATSVMCLGVAIMQPAMPTLVGSWTPARVGLASASYTCGLLCGEVLPVLWPSALDLPLLGGGWRAALFQLSLPVLATLVVIAAFEPRTSRGQASRAVRRWPDWRRGSIWKTGLLLGAVNASYFGLNGFLPGWLASTGGSSQIQPALLALNGAQIPASLLMMVYVERLVLRRTAYAITGLVVLAGSVGLAMAPATLAVAFAAAAGFALGCLLTMALALIPLIVAAEDVPSFSAAVFTVSYAIAVLTALMTGSLQSMGAGQFIGILPIAVAALAVVAIGATIRRPPDRQDGHR